MINLLIIFSKFFLLNDPPKTINEAKHNYIFRRYDSVPWKSMFFNMIFRIVFHQICFVTISYVWNTFLIGTIVYWINPHLYRLFTDEMLEGGSTSMEWKNCKIWNLIRLVLICHQYTKTIATIAALFNLINSYFHDNTVQLERINI